MATAKSKPKSVPKDTATTPVEDSDDVKITVRSTPMVVKTTEPETAKADLSVHHELTITPPSEEVATEPVAPVEPTVEEKSAEPLLAEASDEFTQSSTETQVSSAVAPKPVELPAIEAPKPPTDDAPKTDPMPVAEGAAETKEMQSPKVFDTKQYHLPIDEGVGQGKSKYLMIFMIVLVLAVIAGVVAIDAGWIDAGFDLPFDLIK